MEKAPGDRLAGRRATECRIVELARGQHGVVTRAQLLDIGLTPRTIDRRALDGRLQRLHVGVFGVGAFQPPRAPLMAAVLAGGEGAVLSHRIAAALWGLLEDSSGGGQDVTVPSTARRSRPGIRIHRSARVEGSERTTLDGIPVTTPVRTVVDLAPAMDEAALERVVASAEREKLLTLDELEAVPQTYPGRALGALMTIVRRSGGPRFTRSEAERRFLSLVRRARLPAPACNVRIGEYEVDFLWPDYELAVEVDGYRYHGSRVRFESDRKRAARLAAQGIQVVPLTWRQIVNEELATAVLLGQALQRARRGADPPA